MKLIDADKLREQIDKLKELYRPFLSEFENGYKEGRNDVLDDVLKLIDEASDLSPISSTGLEKAAEEYAKDETMAGLAERAFKAGANWQKEQDKETIELAEDHAMLAGMVKQEEEMKEKALELTVYLDDNGYPCIPEIVLFDFDKNQPTAKEGDKKKVYIFRD